MPSKKTKPPQEDRKLDLDVEDQDEFDDLWLVRALQMVHGEKAQEHGHPYNTYTMVRAGWSMITGVPLTFTQCCYMMVWLKMSRELIAGPHPEEDNNIDAVGYLGVLNRIKLQEVENEARSSTESASRVA